jgi:putative ABC transport system ATP-binding protein
MFPHPRQGVCQKLLKAFSQGNNISLTWAVPLGHACIFALMIDLRGITKSYSTGSQTLQVLKGVDLAVGSGELVAIMGSSGSGKSTLLNILGLLDAYDGGEYKLDGKLVANLSERRAAEMRRELLGFVFQSFNLINFKTASENVALPLYYKKVPRRERTARAHELLERVGLLDWADHLPSQMSGGQKQRVAIARALAANPRVILADEPTGALDSKTSEDVMALLKELNRDGMTMVVVTHEADIAAACQRTIRLRDGVVESGGYV